MCACLELFGLSLADTVLGRSGMFTKYEDNDKN